MKIPSLHEIDRVNLHPLNRISKEWLEKAGVSPDPTNLHALSLISWALEQRAIEVDETGDPLIGVQTHATLLDMGTRWLPEKSMEFLTRAGGASITPDDLQQAGSPVDAAGKLLCCLTNAIISKRQ